MYKSLCVLSYYYNENYNERFSMDKISIKAYAKKHKLSIFNVVKMAKSGQIPTETIVEEGKDVIYVLIDDVVEKIVENFIKLLSGN